MRVSFRSNIFFEHLLVYVKKKRFCINKAHQSNFKSWLFALEVFSLKKSDFMPNYSKHKISTHNAKIF